MIFFVSDIKQVTVFWTTVEYRIPEKASNQIDWMMEYRNDPWTDSTNMSLPFHGIKVMTQLFVQILLDP